MPRFAIGVVALATALALAGSVQAQAPSVAGKSAAYQTSTVDLPNTSTATTLVEVSLGKGRAHTVLEVIATVFQPRGTTRIDVFTPLVNGAVFLNGSNDTSLDCPGAAATDCAVTLVWWLDLDDAESQAHGQIIGKPLTVKLQGFDTTDTGVTVTTNMSARIEPK